MAKRRTLTLAEYLAEEKITAGQFARQVGCAYNTIRRYLIGEQLPRLGSRELQQIIAITRGRVTADSFLPPAPRNGGAFTVQQGA